MVTEREQVEGAYWPWGNDAWFFEVSPEVVRTTFPVYWMGSDDAFGVKVTYDWQKACPLPTKERAEEVQRMFPHLNRMMIVHHSIFPE